MEIRPALASELDACADLYERVVRRTFTWLELGDQRAKFLNEALDEEVYVAVIDGRLAGLAAFYRPDAFLHSLYVDYADHGRGVGSALLAHINSIAAAPVSLKVQSRNTAALDFYKRRGFRIVETSPDPLDHWFRMSR